MKLSLDPASGRSSRLIALGAILVACALIRTRFDEAPARPDAASVGADEVSSVAFEPMGDGARLEREAFAAAIHDGVVSFRPRTPGTASLALETVRASRGHVGESALRASRVDASGAVTLERAGEVAERITPTETTLEQSWHFAELPRGEGDLVVEVRFAGMQAERTSALGVHFRALDGARARYGHATFIDAAGARTAVPVEVRGDRLAMHVPARVLEDAAYPAVLDPIVSAERDVDPPVLIPGGGSEASSIACGETQCLAVWQDGRSGEPEIWGTRVDSTDGTVLDPAGFPIATTADAEESRSPRAGFDGDHYFVVYAAKVEGTDDDIHARRVGTDGVVLGDGPIVISSASGYQSAPALARDATRWLVAWEDGRTSPAAPDVYGTFVSFPGQVSQSNGFPISAAAHAQQKPEVATNGTAFFVVWADGRARTPSDIDATQIFGSRISAAGLVQDPSGIELSAGNRSYGPRVAVLGPDEDYLVAWRADTDDGDLVSRRISSTGILLDDMPRTLRGGAGDQTVASIVALGDGTAMLSYLDSGTTSTALMLQPITVMGEAVVSAVTHVPTGVFQRGMALATDGTRLVATWAQDTAAGFDLLLQRRSLAGAALEASTPLARASQTESFVDVVRRGDEYLVAWTDTRFDTEGDIYAMIVDGNGVPKSQSAIGVATSGLPEVMPRVAALTDGYAIVYTVLDGGVPLLRARDLDPNGAVNADPPVAVYGSSTELAFSYAIAGRGNDALVAFHAFSGAEITLAKRLRLLPTGQRDLTVLDAVAIQIAVSPIRMVQVAVGATENSWLVAGRRDGAAIRPLLGRVVDATGAAMGTTPFTISDTANGAYEDPAIASDGSRFLVVASRENGGVAHQDLLARYVGASGALDAPSFTLAATADYWDARPDVTYDGEKFVAVYAHVGEDETDCSLLGAEIIEQAVSTFTLVPGAPCAENPAIASRGDRTSLVAYERYKRDDDESSSRIRLRLVSPLRTNGAACAADAECISGACDDGVCCGTACGDDTTDCAACSVAAGGSADGTCTPITAESETVCRGANDGCDPAEVCDGVATACPADERAPDEADCDDGLACNGEDICQSGVCVHEVPNACFADGGVDVVDQPSYGFCAAAPGRRGGSLPVFVVLCVLAVVLRRSRLAAPVLAAVLLLGGTSLSHAQPEDPEAVARAHFTLGQALYTEGNYEGAAREFTAAYEASHRPQLLYNIYLAHQASQNLVEAESALARYLDAAPESATAGLRARLERLREEIVQREQAAAEAAAEAEALRARAASAEAMTPVPGTEDRPSRRGRRIAGYASIGTSGAALALALTGVFRTRAESDALSDLCGPAGGVPRGSCPDTQAVRSHIDAQRTWRVLGWTGIGLSAAALGTGLVLVLTGRDEDAPVQGDAECGPSGCEARLRVRF